jgi:hypothetical protein
MRLWVCVMLLLVGRSFAFVPRSRQRGLVPAASWMLRKPSSKSDTTAAAVVPVGSSSALWAQGEAAVAQVPAVARPSLSKQLISLTRLITRVSWLSWWTQITLSIISGVILTFAGTVRAAEPGIQVYCPLPRSPIPLCRPFHTSSYDSDIYDARPDLPSDLTYPLAPLTCTRTEPVGFRVRLLRHGCGAGTHECAVHLEHHSCVSPHQAR